MAIIYTNQKSKPKKKPGWKKEAEDYAAWLQKHGVNSSPLRAGARSKRSSRVIITRPSTSSYQLQEEMKTKLTPSISQKFDHHPKPDVKVHDPRVLYKDDPDMLERELKARERKFLTAPAYNKGGDILVTPELLKDIQAGGTRRRG